MTKYTTNQEKTKNNARLLSLLISNYQKKFHRNIKDLAEYTPFHLETYAYPFTDLRLAQWANSGRFCLFVFKLITLP